MNSQGRTPPTPVPHGCGARANCEHARRRCGGLDLLAFGSLFLTLGANFRICRCQCVEHRWSQIPNDWDFGAVDRRDLHEVVGRRLAHIELGFDPESEVAMTNFELHGFRNPADFDEVLPDPADPQLGKCRCNCNRPSARCSPRITSRRRRSGQEPSAEVSADGQVRRGSQMSLQNPAVIMARRSEPLRRPSHPADASRRITMR